MTYKLWGKNLEMIIYNRGKIKLKNYLILSKKIFLKLVNFGILLKIFNRYKSMDQRH